MYKSLIACIGAMALVVAIGCCPATQTSVFEEEGVNEGQTSEIEKQFKPEFCPDDREDCERDCCPK